MNRKQISEAGSIALFLIMIAVILIAVFKVSGANSLYKGTKDSDEESEVEIAEDRNGFDKDTNTTVDVFNLKCSIPDYLQYQEEGYFSSDEPVEMYIWGLKPDTTFGYDLTTDTGLKSYSNIMINTYATEDEKEFYDVSSQENITVNGYNAKLYYLNHYRGSKINMSKLLGTGYEVIWYDSNADRVYMFMIEEEKSSEYEYFGDFMDIVESANIN